MIGDVTGKSVLVVGGTRGIGHAIARRLIEGGAEVGITGRDAAVASSVAASLGDRATGYGLDVKDVDAIDETVARFADEHGHADSLVYSAGTSPTFTSGEKLAIADWESIVRINLTGAFAASQALARRAIAKVRPSSIVLIGSIAGSAGAARLTAYAASKAGLVGLAKSLALDWARYGIRVNVLAPGWVETDMTAGVRSNESLKQWIETRTPQRRMASPDEIADMAVFLVSDSASFATGDVFMLDGGWTSG